MTPAAVTSAQGLDVSNFQGKFNWQNAARTIPGLSFGVFRLTQGLGGGHNSPDPDAPWNHAQIAAHGLHRGAYHFLDPGTSGAAQAESFVTQYSRLGLTAQDMLWLDNETPGATPAATAACAQAFMAELGRLAPHNPQGVYTFIDFARQGHCAGLGGYPLWLAFPSSAAPAAPPPWTRWTFWQWGQRSTDADAFNGTAAALDQWITSHQPRGATAPATQKPPPPPGQWFDPAAWTWKSVSETGIGLDGKKHTFELQGDRWVKTA